MNIKTKQNLLPLLWTKRRLSKSRNYAEKAFWDAYLHILLNSGSGSANPVDLRKLKIKTHYFQALNREDQIKTLNKLEESGLVIKTMITKRGKQVHAWMPK